MYISYTFTRTNNLLKSMLFSEIGPGPFTYRKLTSIKKC